MTFILKKTKIFFSDRKYHLLSFLIIFLLNLIPYFYRLDYEKNIYDTTFIHVIINVITPSLIATLIIVIITSNLKKYHLFIAIFFSILWLINSYILIIFGSYDFSVIASVIDSTPTESVDYLKNMHIPLQLYFVVPYFYLLNRCRCVNNKKFNLFSIITLFILCIPLMIDSYFILKDKGELMGEHDVKGQYTEGLNIKGLVRNVIRKDNNIQLLLSIKRVYVFKEIENEQIIPEWTNIRSSKNSKKYNYIIIIGESSPRKAFSYYQPNSKLDQYIGWEFISDAISPATNTRESITRLLSKNKVGHINKNLNLIDLANIGGLDTYWFSNQGFMGEYDTPVTNLAKRSQHTIFHNKGDFSKSESDNKLLVDLKETVSDSNTGKLIFLHTIGSHPSFCRRSEYYELHIKNYNPDDERSCFKDNIYNIELYINKVNTIMKSTKNNYKIIYFSDHGLTDVDYSPYEVHGVGKLFSKNAINIPLIFINSTNKNKGELVKKKYYMRDFVNTFSDWTEITANEIDKALSIYNKNISQEAYIYQGSSLRKL